MAYCYCFGKPWYFGPWDQESDKPSAEAEIAFLRQVQQWATNPDGAAKGIADDRRMSVANGGPLFISLWADWRAAPGTFCPVNGQMDTCERLLFMGPVAEGMNHSHTTISEFTLPAFSDWQERLCAKRRRDDGRPWYARATVKKHITMILKCFQWGVQKGRVSFEHYAMLKLIAPPQKSLARASESRKIVGEDVVMAMIEKVKPCTRPLL